MALVFRPRPAASLFTALALPVLIALGVWQLVRHGWKQELKAEIAAGLAAAPQALPPQPEPADRWDWQRVRLEGRFAHDAAMRLGPRIRGGVAGWHLVTPLLRADGPPVLVDRGWVPDAPDAPLHRPPDPVSVTGIARLPAGRTSLFQPDNEPAAGRWFWVDLPAMGAAAGLAEVAPLLVEADPDGAPGTFPLGGQSRLVVPDNHLAYALTWFAFALTLAVIYVAAHLRRIPDGDS